MQSLLHAQVFFESRVIECVHFLLTEASSGTFQALMLAFYEVIGINGLQW